MNRAQLEQQARDFGTEEAVVGDFIVFQVPGDVNISCVLGKVDSSSGLAVVLKKTTPPTTPWVGLKYYCLSR